MLLPNKIFLLLNSAHFYTLNSSFVKTQLILALMELFHDLCSNATQMVKAKISTEQG